ncbi:uncharacterized protein LOC129607616 [Condylostylus longicornis]|uniref:uncharacterized protein LOC129607616 n=1 Tax=Condylostylus longicornis TaxID=2530218 RepID=UPI00244DD3CE|nr:uncharacterized protein LOC129607616 [Condylostylus longicornis]XP_055374679.1 uncharacterized protein LOC129607616 [Condylostylus longicornis]XP_055374680.1 uncharacterized protein LOC129607616 [Condylostylus longicornis]XP_055374681.1 uncharacterized protein LOC129607616 [Condylostylus longicornis]
MSRREHSMPPPSGYPERRRGRCLAAICVFWKFLSSFTVCILSHVTLISLVVAYCVGGAALFEKLEAENEIEVKRGIRKIRKNVSDFIWDLTDKQDYLRLENWTSEVEKRLAFFETEILSAMKTQGWDGNEDENQLQWTFHGALFYSIIVITTIGYGHIAPRTDWGKVTTIFYAIIGIPLMLLCLSNIGDVMATSFRFLYWRICCYACTRRPKRRRARSSTRLRYSQRYSRSQPPSTAIRRSIRASQRSADSGFVTYDPPGGLFHAYSDPDIRLSNYDEINHRHRRFNDDDDEVYRRGDRRMERDYPRSRRSDHHRDYRNFDYGDNEVDYDVERQPSNRNSRYSNRQQQRERMRDRHTVERERSLSRGDSFNTPTGNKRPLGSRTMRSGSVGRDVYSMTVPSPKHNRSKSQPNTPKSRAKSVDPRTMRYDEVDDEVARKTPILCNRWAIDEMDRRESHISTRVNKRRSFGDENCERSTVCDAGGASGNGNSPRYKSVPPRNFGSNSDRTSSYRNNIDRDRDDRYDTQPRYGSKLDVPESSGLRRNYEGGSQRRKNNDRDSYYHKTTPRSSRSSRYDDYYDDEFDEDIEMQPIRSARDRPRMSRRPTVTAQPLPPSPRIMSPMGFAVHRQQQARMKPVYDDDSWNDDDITDPYGDMAQVNRPVPIWLCVFLVVSYIIAGAFLFASWEKWSFLDSAYFCFITLTTIGFGDFVPAQGVKESSKESIALCSLYLLFGIALLAMSFNLVQEEVIANVKEIARRLGILKEQEPIDE